MTAPVIGTFDPVTKSVPVTFTYQNVTYDRKIKAVITSGAYDAAATTLAIDKLVSGFVYRSEFEAIAETVVSGSTPTSTWINLPAIYYLILNGTGNVSIDTQTRTGTVVTNVVTYTVSGSETPEYPYFDTSISMIRINVTGSALATLV